MGRSIALVMVVSMLAAGCSPVLSRVRVGFGPGAVHLATVARPPQDRSAGEASPAALQAVATKIPVGAKVKVRMR